MKLNRWANQCCNRTPARVGSAGEVEARNEPERGVYAASTHADASALELFLCSGLPQ
jgi:hypothetical protein